MLGRINKRGSQEVWVPSMVEMWAPHHPHVVPAIRGFNLPRMNMAEVGQSKMKPEKCLWLTEAVKVDIVK